MKKLGLLVLLAFCACLLFAQEGEKKIAVWADVFPTIKGFIAAGEFDEVTTVTAICLAGGAEYYLSPGFSIGGGLDTYFGSVKFDLGPVTQKVEYFYFALTGQARWYLTAQDHQKLFVGADLGFNRFSIEGKSKAKDGGFSGLIAALKLGYKIQYPKNIYIEPSMSYVLSKTSGMEEELGATFVTPRGWQGGLRVGYVF